MPIKNYLHLFTILNYGGYKKSAIGGLILVVFKAAKLPKISCVRFLIFSE